MAENRETSHNTNRNRENPPNNLNTNLDETTPPLNLDLGDDGNRLSGCSNTINPGAEVSNSNRREDNPFSFKHFLRCDSANYQNKGARPKVYCEGRPVSSISDLESIQTDNNNGGVSRSSSSSSSSPPSTSSGITRPTGTKSKQTTRLISEYSSALPDFVQDHIVVEQCYLGNNTNSNFNLDINLPDFTPNRNSSNVNRIKIESSQQQQQRCDNNDLSIPLDLPIRRQQNGFPLDLPIARGDTLENNPRNCTPNEVGVSKSLPDFLTDGAVRTQQQSDDSSIESPERECERLKRELDVARQQIAEQTMCIENLTKEVELARNRERDYTENLTRALEQVEENLQRSNVEIQRLRKENRALRGEEGAAGGHDFHTPSEILHSHRLAQELKAAATTAEHSLRQLLNGVDNLRMMASTLENLHRIEETSRETFYDFDDNTGPAL